MKMIPAIQWRYHYLQNCKEVTVIDEIDLTPDHMNRWQIRGYFMVDTKAMPEYKVFGEQVSVPCCWITQKGCLNSPVPSVDDNFACKFSHVYDINIGFGESYFYGKTPNELMMKIQEAFAKTYKIFMNLK